MYVLRDPEIDVPWTAKTDLIDPDTGVDCGPVTVIFFNHDDTQLDTTIFFDD